MHCSDMRLRLPEALEERQLTAYEVAKRSNGRILSSTLYRLSKQRGSVKYIDAELLEALCDVLGVGPGELLERDASNGKRKRSR